MKSIMKTKMLLTGLVMAAVICCTACRGNAKTNETSVDNTSTKVETYTIRNDKLFTSSDMYNASEKQVVIDHNGRPGADPVFGVDHFSHYAVLFPKQNGGLVKGFVSVSTKGIALQAEKSFFFYNSLCLEKDPMKVNLPAGIILKDGTIVPAMVKVNGKDQPYYASIERKDNDKLSYKPLRGDFAEISFTVKQMKDFCEKNKLTSKKVPFLVFEEVNQIPVNVQ